jgi:hypothetical protein
MGAGSHKSGTTERVITVALIVPDFNCAFLILFYQIINARVSFTSDTARCLPLPTVTAEMQLGGRIESCTRRSSQRPVRRVQVVPRAVMSPDGGCRDVWRAVVRGRCEPCGPHHGFILDLNCPAGLHDAHQRKTEVRAWINAWYVWGDLLIHQPSCQLNMFMMWIRAVWYI